MKDSEFIRGNVPMTKEEVRLITLDRLALNDAQHFIDVGAGTGSIAIEAALCFPQLQVLAIERNPEAVELIQANCGKFNVNNVDIIHQSAPLDLPANWQQVDGIFIGGNGGNLHKIIDWSHQHLKPNGRLVLNFILLNNLMSALDYLKESQFDAIDVVQLQISNLTTLGSGVYFKPNNPTFIISCHKTCNTTTKENTDANSD